MTKKMKSKVTMWLFAGASALAIPTAAVAGPGDGKKTAPARVADADRVEVVHRHHVNLMEIEMGKLASARGTAEVKKYGAMLVADHTTADAGVKDLAGKRGIKLTDHPMAGDAEAAEHTKAMALMAKLKGLDGNAFDREYLAAMVDGHTKELARVGAALPQMTDADVRALLDKTLPSLQKHADGAKALLASTPTATPSPSLPPSAPPSPLPPPAPPPMRK
jgi:putative membrane protein